MKTQKLGKSVSSFAKEQKRGYKARTKGRGGFKGKILLEEVLRAVWRVNI